MARNENYKKIENGRNYELQFWRFFFASLIALLHYDTDTFGGGVFRG
ncbi:hypothetical protein AALB16_08040 [Lachnospiraceae bacterium 62-35]